MQAVVACDKKYAAAGPAVFLSAARAMGIGRYDQRSALQSIRHFSQTSHSPHPALTPGDEIGALTDQEKNNVGKHCDRR